MLAKKHMLRKRTVVAMLMASQLSMLTSQAQEFFNLTADEVKIDSVLPLFEYTWPVELPGRPSALAGGAAGYTVSIEYPEFIDMTASDIARLKSLTDKPLPALPTVETSIGVSRKKAMLHASFVPLVQRDGKYQKLVSFKLRLKANGGHAESRATRAEESENNDSVNNSEPERYASHSILANGQWAKISVAQTGVHQLTDALVRQAGFSSLSKVKIYGYGGALQPEALTAGYLAATDDLHEVPTFTTANGRRLFYAVGPVGWESATATTRIRNP